LSNPVIAGTASGTWLIGVARKTSATRLALTAKQRSETRKLHQRRFSVLAGTDGMPLVDVVMVWSRSSGCSVGCPVDRSRYIENFCSRSAEQECAEEAGAADTGFETALRLVDVDDPGN